MQFLLMGYGYDMEGYGADGSFGGATERAVKAYQSANGLDADGSCGPKTWTKLLGLE
jgi:peptidoglycan hydrolase-like protein with peptidoglycan-binding domain